jgi:hypothetical protein
VVKGATEATLNAWVEDGKTKPSLTVKIPGQQKSMRLFDAIVYPELRELDRLPIKVNNLGANGEILEDEIRELIDSLDAAGEWLREQ